MQTGARGADLRNSVIILIMPTSLDCRKIEIFAHYQNNMIYFPEGDGHDGDEVVARDVRRQFADSGGGGVVAEKVLHSRTLGRVRHCRIVHYLG